VSGFRESRWSTMQRMRPGDYLLCYLTGVSRWIGILEVASEPFPDTTPIWKHEDFPCRVKVRPIALLIPETAVPVMDLRDQLSCFQDLKNPNAWTGHFRGSPTRWSASDGEAVVRAVVDAQAHPVARPVDPAKLARRPKAIKSRIGPVTIPEPEAGEHGEERESDTLRCTEETAHTEIQWRLLKLGSDMGYDVWAATNDRGRAWQGQPFTNIRGLRTQLPRQLDEDMSKAIKMIDVLWLRGPAVVAAFEIERTASIHSGLLRMADLVAVQPNLTIPLYLVAPSDRRDKVFEEISRPTFSRLSPSLAEVCHYISFETLRDELARVGEHARHLKLSFLAAISESCLAEEP
jgi:hypothetical protein